MIIQMWLRDYSTAEMCVHFWSAIPPLSWDEFTDLIGWLTPASRALHCGKHCSWAEWTGLTRQSPSQLGCMYIADQEWECRSDSGAFPPLRCIFRSDLPCYISAEINSHIWFACWPLHPEPCHLKNISAEVYLHIWSAMLHLSQDENTYLIQGLFPSWAELTHLIRLSAERTSAEMRMQI